MDEHLTIRQFKKWLTTLISNKEGALPDLNDWIVIKSMLDNAIDEYDHLSRALKYQTEKYEEAIKMAASYKLVTRHELDRLTATQQFRNSCLSEHTFFSNSKGYINIGDKVTLNSGGPVMSVREIVKLIKNNFEFNVLCVWVDDDNIFHQGWFISSTLLFTTTVDKHLYPEART